MKGTWDMLWYYWDGAVDPYSGKGVTNTEMFISIKATYEFGFVEYIFKPLKKLGGILAEGASAIKN